MNKTYLVFLLLWVFFSCKEDKSIGVQPLKSSEALTEIPETKDSVLFVDGFDFPVGKPDAKGYYDAQHFGANNHLGEDWNGNKGSNTDLGDTIYAIGNGYVSLAEDLKGGWGNVIRIVHEFPKGREVESLYAHCDEIFVKPLQIVERGQAIGTIGTANGKYMAHLHFEIRDKVGMPIGPGYSKNAIGYLNPSKFINRIRKVEWEK